MNDDEIQAAIHRAEATPVGPWQDAGVDCFHDGENFVRLILGPRPWSELLADIHTDAFNGNAAAADLKAKAIVTFIVAARADVPALGGELLAARVVLQECIWALRAAQRHGIVTSPVVLQAEAVLKGG